MGLLWEFKKTMRKIKRMKEGRGLKGDHITNATSSKIYIQQCNIRQLIINGKKERYISELMSYQKKVP